MWFKASISRQLKFCITGFTICFPSSLHRNVMFRVTSCYGTWTFSTWDSYNGSVMQSRQLQLSRQTGHPRAALLLQGLGGECTSPKSFTAQGPLKSNFRTLRQTFAFYMLKPFFIPSFSCLASNYTSVSNPLWVSQSFIFLLF